MISYIFILFTLQTNEFPMGAIQKRKCLSFVSSKFSIWSWSLETVETVCQSTSFGWCFRNSSLERIPGEFFGKHWNLSTWNWVWYGWRCLYLNQVDGASRGKPCRGKESCWLFRFIWREREREMLLVFLFCCELFDVWWWYDIFYVKSIEVTSRSYIYIICIYLSYHIYRLE